MCYIENETWLCDSSNELTNDVFMKI